MKTTSSSNRQEVRTLIRRHVRKGGEVSLYRLAQRLRHDTQRKLRQDYLVCDMLGMKGFMVDCETNMVIRLKDI